MTDERITNAVREIAEDMIRTARAAPTNEPVQFVTGNSFMPPLRSYEAAEAVWRYDGSHDTFHFEELVEQLEQTLMREYVLLDVPDYDNALYVVDLARFEYVEDADGDSLQDEWRPIPNPPNPSPTIYGVSVVLANGRHLPTFYLFANVQGIVSEQHAHSIACQMMDACGHSDASVSTVATSWAAHS